MEGTQEVAKKVGESKFTPIPDLDKMRVGHAGIYEPDDEDNNIDATDVEAEVVNILELGANGMKTMLSVEDGIKRLVEELAKDKENHLPNSRVGVYVHYLVKGLKEDFNIKFDRTPESISKKGSTRTLKAKEDKIPFLSKKDKNELLAKLTYQYYENDVNNGVITQAEAFAMMSEEAAKKKMYEDKGLFLSSNKTQGVALFDWKTEILNEWDGDGTKLKIYSRHSIIPVIPCIFGKDTNKMHMRHTNKFVNKEMNKSILEDMTKFDGKEYFIKKIEGWDDTKKHYAPKSFHIAKINQSGKMKDRWFVVDAIRNTDGKQVLLMWDKNGVDGILE